MSEPVAVWDCREGSWNGPDRQARMDWLHERGVPDKHIWRVEFYAQDAPFARVFAYHLDEQGRRHWTHGHNPKTCKPDHTCGPCELTPYDLLLTGLPTAELLGVPA